MDDEASARSPRSSRRRPARALLNPAQQHRDQQDVCIVQGSWKRPSDTPARPPSANLCDDERMPRDWRSFLALALRVEDRRLPACSTIIAVVLLLLLWVDRIVLCFCTFPSCKQPFHTRGARQRRGRLPDGPVGARRDGRLVPRPSICNRWSGFSSKALPWIDRVLRSGIAAVAAFSFIQETASRRLSVLCVLAAIHSR